jgi:signal transduction histidine kinase
MDKKDSSPDFPPSASSHDGVAALEAALEQSQVDIEADKLALVRLLHDDLGGILVGATMDMGWIALQPGLVPMVREKLARAQALMRAAIDMTRDLIETTRPTLLENVGLYPTLRWHMKASCKAASVPYTESFPDSEGAMAPDIRIGIFRIFQEALKDVLSERTPSDLSVSVEMIGAVLHCHLVHQSEGRSGNAAHCPSPEASMHRRAQRVGGSLQWSTTVTGRHLHLQVPIPAVEEPHFTPE